jgi:hypothetical protein
VPNGFCPTGPPALLPLPWGAIYTSSFTYNTISTAYGLLGALLWGKEGCSEHDRRTDKIEQSGLYGKEGRMVERNDVKAKGYRQANRGIT